MSQAYEIQPASIPERSTPRASEDERPIGAIVTHLWENTERLVRQEMKLGLTEAEEKVELLKHELSDRLQELKRELAAKAIGGAVAVAGALAVVAAIILLLAQVMMPWLAALLTGVVCSGVGYALLKREVELPAPPPAAALVPERTIETLKADTRAIEEATHGTAK